MSTYGRVKQFENAMREHFGDADSRGLVLVITDEDDNFIADVYHDRVTGREIPGMYEAVKACKDFDELRQAIGKHASNVPKGVD